MKNFPQKTLLRLSLYRRTLLNLHSEGKYFIYSHQLAEILHLTPEQVRNDLMLLGYSTSARKGYDIQLLIDSISNFIGIDQSVRIALIGIGNLGTAIIGYISCNRTNHKIIAAFDKDPKKVDKLFMGIQCYNVERLEEIIRSQNITLAIITTNKDAAQEITDSLSRAGIKAIINFTSLPLKVNKDIHLEQHDILASLEKIAYFVKNTGSSINQN